MGALNLRDWHKLPISLTELCINTTLKCGQTFRWRKSDEGIWSMALHGRILRLYQDPENLYYRSIFPTSNLKPNEDDTLPLLKHYLNLGPNLEGLYAQWSSNDANFKRKAPKFTGIRILKQDAWEALVGFICSSNNNIIRISQMVDKLCRNYGPLLGSVEDEEYYDFPTPASLAVSGVEQKLRDLGFGYRAKYIYKTACMLAEKDERWLDGLRNSESPCFGVDPSPGGEFVDEGREGYRRAHEELLTLQGVGPKVADCVCLMGLGWGEAVPVDTHVWQIAQRDYKFGKGKHSSLTKVTYDLIANKFRSLWGKEAGWAQSVLFTANLKAFSERLIAKTEVVEETEFKKEPDGIKIEEDETAAVDTIVETDKVLIKGIKREADGEEQKLVETKHNVVKKTKRRRKA
ncbi:DNA glycosylase [Delphinella strobiligena]|nr:DNA glycosylase [Delphinella strobiligena]